LAEDKADEPEFSSNRFGVTKNGLQLVQYNIIAQTWMTDTHATIPTTEVIVFPESCDNLSNALERARLLLRDQNYKNLTYGK
jgi:hypothetical protein